MNPSTLPAFPAAMPRRLVIIAPHPDDETLGCGLLIAQAVRQGIDIAVIALTDGQASHPRSRRWPPAALGRLRRGELRRALARLGAPTAAIRTMGWGDGEVAAQGSALRLRAVLLGLRTGIVVAASPADHHPDHQAAWRLAAAATRGTAMRLAAYAVWSRLAMKPCSRVRDAGRAAKHWAIGAHRSQISDYISDDPDGFSFTAQPLARLLREPETLRLHRRHRKVSRFPPT